MASRVWSRDELILALNLYHRIPFGRIHHGNPEVMTLARLIGRSANSVALRLANFAHLDPNLDRRGMSGVSAAARRVWEEYEADPEAVIIEAERLLAERGEPSLLNEAEDGAPEGLDREATVKARVNQAYFRRLVLARYDSVCCVTGLNVPELLVAAHIVRWADDPGLRLNPRNALCLNPLHDRAFERGLMVVTDDLKVHVSPAVDGTRSAVRCLLTDYEGAPLSLVGDVSPDPQYLRRHRERFQWSAGL